ncbi:hypothetical protein FQA47_010248 [Oryzias melastigma]|uniref:Uncharacterized protein n=1 Tax=Oryzias melastigma TaxID=30732 RepID=A0A834KXT7_ORYME|nr:hypothetical protein FQA47_010248 [Oryzias melastigma]
MILSLLDLRYRQHISKVTAPVRQNEIHLPACPEWCRQTRGTHQFLLHVCALRLAPDLVEGGQLDLNPQSSQFKLFPHAVLLPNVLFSHHNSLNSIKVRRCSKM